MGIDCRIYLPSHANTRKVFEVIKKTMGAEIKQEVFSKTTYNHRSNKKTESFPEFDPSSPADESNPWHVTFEKNPKHNLNLKDENYFEFEFTDPLDTYYRCLIHFDNYESDRFYPGGKELLPSSTAVWCVIGKRLVDFFGGRLLYSDASDEDDPANWYICEKGKFGPAAPEQSSNDRWYEYHNAIFNEPLITSKEINDMAQCAYMDERSQNLYDYLVIQEKIVNLKNKLDNTLEEKADNISRKSSKKKI